MKWKLFILFVLLLMLESCVKKELVVSETGIGKIQVGKTTKAKISRIHLFAKKRNLSMHMMFRTDNGRGCVRQITRLIKTKNGITYYFVYDVDTPRPVRLKYIQLNEKSTIKTDKGVQIGVSTFEEVKAKYGPSVVKFVAPYFVLAYKHIEFKGVSKSTGNDSSEVIVVTSIKIH